MAISQPVVSSLKPQGFAGEKSDQSDRSQAGALIVPLLPDTVGAQEVESTLPQALPIAAPSLVPITWSFDRELPSLATKRRELESLISGLESKRDLKHLKKDFNSKLERYRKDIDVLGDLIKLCSRHYAVQLFHDLCDDYTPIRSLYEKFSEALKEHSLEKRHELSRFLSQELKWWGDKFLEKGSERCAGQLLSEAKLFYLTAFRIIDQAMGSTTLNSPHYLPLLEKMGDAHVAMRDYSEGMKCYFAVHNHEPSTPLHQKMVRAYLGFLAHMGITEYFLARIETDEYSEERLETLTHSRDFIKSIGDELLIQEKFYQAAALYQLGGASLSKEASIAFLLGDAAKRNAHLIQQEFQLRGVVYQLIKAEGGLPDEISSLFPWSEFQKELRSIRKELEPLKGLEAQKVTTEKMLTLFQKLIQRAFAILGPHTKEGIEVPYAFLSLGSMSFSGMSLYSDLEFMILVEQSELEVISHFTTLTQVLEMLTIFFGETPPRDFEDDHRFQRGFGFDSKGNTPLGAGQHRQGRRGCQSLDLNIKTPTEMVAMIPPKGGVLEDLVRSHALCGANFAFGDPTLFDRFLKERSDVLNPYSRLFCTDVFIKEALSFPTELYVEGKFNVKKNLYRMLSLLILELSLYYEIKEFTLSNRLDGLTKLGVIDNFFADKIREGLDYAATLRNRAQSHYRNEEEDVYKREDGRQFTLTDVEYLKLFEVYTTILLPIRKYVELLEHSLEMLKSGGGREPLPRLCFDNPVLQGMVGRYTLSCDPPFRPKNLKEALVARDESSKIVQLVLNHVGLRNIEDRNLEEIVQCYPSLRALNLSGCERITSRCLQAIVKRYCNLHTLNLYKCQSITDADLAKVMHCRPDLQVVVSQGASLYGPASWEIWNIEVLDDVPAVPKVEWNQKNRVLLYIPHRVRVHGEEQDFCASVLRKIRPDLLRLDAIVEREFGDKVAPGWVYIDKDVLVESRGKNYEIQKSLVEGQGARLPSFLEAIALNLMAFAFTEERLYGEFTYVRCSEKVEEDQYPVVVGGFGSRGIEVHSISDDSVYFGAACARRGLED